MTSQVIVHAHCGDNKEVHVEVTGDQYLAGNKVNVLQNGEKLELSVFDDKAVTVKEVLK